MRKRNKLYTVNKWNASAFQPKENQFGGGGAFFKGIGGSFTGSNSGSFGGYGQIIGANTMAIGDTPVQEVAGVKMRRGMWDAADPLYYLSGDKSSAVGDAFSDAGVSMFKSSAQRGDLWGMAAGGITKGIGSLFNAAIGKKTDQQKLKAAQAGTNALNRFNSTASTTDQVEGPMAVADVEDAHEGGWFTKGWARRENEKVRLARYNAQQWANRAVGNNVENIMGDQISTGLSNYAAFGGPLDTMAMNNNMGALEYGFLSDYLANKKKQANNDNTNILAGMPMYALGGDLEETAPADATYINRSLLMSPISSPYYKKGNTYHSDKYGDVSIDKAGNYWTAYRGPKAGSNENWRHMLSSEEIEDFKKDHENYYNTASVTSNIPLVLGISKNPGLDKIVAERYPMRESFKQDFAFGGDLETNIADFPTGLTHIDAGSSHEANPNDGVQMGVDSQGVPNLVEEGEVVYDDYVYSVRIPIDDATKEKFHINKKKEMTYADLAKRLEKEIAERSNDPISQAGFEAQMHSLADEQERQKQEMEAEKARQAFESLSDEEKVALMQRTAQEEQMAQEAMAQQAMQEQAAQQQTQISPEEAAMMEQQMATQQEEIPQEQMAEGGNLFADGGALEWLEKNHPEMGNKKAIAAALEKHRQKFGPNVKLSIAYSNAYSDITKGMGNFRSPRAIGIYGGGEEERARKHYNELLKWGLPRKVAFGLAFPEVKQDNPRYAEAYKKQNKERLRLYNELIVPHLENTTNMKEVTITPDNTGSNDDFTMKESQLKGNPQAVPPVNRAQGTPTVPPVATPPITGNKATVSTTPTTEATTPITYGATQNTEVNSDFARENPMIAAPSNEVPSDANWAPEWVPEEQRREWAALHTPTATAETAARVAKSYNKQAAPTKTAPSEEDIVPVHKAEWPRYAGLLGPAVGLGMMAAGVGKPDYSYLDAAVASMGEPALADYKPIGNYLTYRPMDIWYEQNRLNANARATDRALMNNATPVGSKMAGLLANSYNNQIASGNLYRQALEYNDAKKAQVEDFNRGTNQFNAEAYNRLSQFNADAINRAKQHRAQLALSAANTRLDNDAGWYNSLYGNVSGLFKGIGELGRENVQTNWRNALTTSGAFGVMDEDALVNAGLAKRKKKSKGGKINRKRGLTF